MMVRKAGRPNEKTDARESLISCSRELFVTLPYDKVSTRMIAQKANVNAAMIRYYFGNKEGLFEAMIRETMKPVVKQLRQFSEDDTHKGLGEIMKAYYQTMGKTPQFPRLIAQIMNMPPSDVQRKLLEKIFSEVSSPIEKKLAEKNEIRPDMDPKLCRITFMSMMVFPFLAPPSMMKVHGIELNQEFLDELLEHNLKVFAHGFQATEMNTISGDNNEN
ncbi:TetR/AcrR family transcriptional regulator [Vibrio hannami]|uniref:TetR/AcrR family transcriptional regulator n=1 Tax=Vibrio hannami TaxID=2717094 RepID=UPI003EBDAA06